MKWKDRKILARFRCGNETKAREYWKEGEKRCGLCKKKEEDLRHVKEECETTGGPKDTEKH